MGVGGHVPSPSTLRNGKDASMEGPPAQSGPNRGTNTGSPTPGGIVASAKAGVAQRGGQVARGAARKGAVVIPGAGRGATEISGTHVGGRAKRG